MGDRAFIGRHDIYACFQRLANIGKGGLPILRVKRGQFDEERSPGSPAHFNEMLSIFYTGSLLSEPA
jgi:hypothetical protein